MSLKEITKEKHTEAEHTPFMKAVFDKTMPEDIWADYTHGKMLWYNAIECVAKAKGFLDDLPGIERAHRLYLDYKDMTKGETSHSYSQEMIDYYKYIIDLEGDKVLAHLYTWHMGDMYGGQMIKKIIPGPHRNLEFDDPETLKTTLRSKLHDGLGDEAVKAFEWAIKIMHTYDNRLV